jgi:peptidoglycan L-alanyl-D-glutamate endopeptidase CwlK
MDAISYTRLALLYPELVRRWKLVDERAAALSIITRVTQGMRTFPEQNALWRKGRNPDGTFVDPIHRHGVVTYAKGGQSYHNYGLALDFGVMEISGQLVESGDDPRYMQVVEIAEEFGLTCGMRWHDKKRDPDHIQLTGDFFENEPDTNCRYIFDEGGMAAIWDEVNKALKIDTSFSAKN